MTLFESLILGIVQGITEFLPISSSGHLILMRDALDIQSSGGLAYDAILQLATALAVIAYFRKTIFSLIVSAYRMLFGLSKNGDKEERTLLVALVAGTIPAIAIGVLLENLMETAFRSARLVALMLIAGSILFIAAEKFAKKIETTPSVIKGWWIGWFQTLALIPGVSRSGATISGGLLLGLTRESAARFSFLLSVPIIAGSGIKKLIDVMLAGNQDFSAINLLVGSFAAFFVGFACIHFLITFLKKHTLYPFVIYRLALAMVVFLLAR